MRAARTERSAWRRLAWLLAIALSLALTVYPPLATGASGRAAHGPLMLLLWGIAGGFVSGVGFVPRQPWLRVALSAHFAVPLMSAASVYLIVAA
jgi:predicted membrane protein